MVFDWLTQEKGPESKEKEKKEDVKKEKDAKEVGSIGVLARNGEAKQA